MRTGVYGGLVRSPQHVGTLWPQASTTERVATLGGIALVAGAIAKVATGSWVWAAGMAVAAPVVVGVGLVLGMRSALATSGFTPSPTPNQNPSAPAGVVPTQKDSAGATLVVVKPGNMGTLTMVSTDSGPQPGQPGPQPPALDIQAPSGGALLNVTSSNHNVLFDQGGSPTTAGVAMGQPLMKGTSTISIDWKDPSGTPQKTTFTLIAT